jgi:hypothetical protein
MVAAWRKNQPFCDGGHISLVTQVLALSAIAHKVMAIYRRGESHVNAIVAASASGRIWS